MKTPLRFHPEDDADSRLEALVRAARGAPLPRAADRLAIGFGARAEARIQAAAAETAGVSRLLWRWLTGLGVCAAIVLATAGVGTGALGSGSADSDSSFQAEWASYTEVPDVWPQ